MLLLADMFGIGFSAKTLVLAAHPDDETVGAGAVLNMLKAPCVLFLTDGAPRDLKDAQKHGFASREDYAHARAQESNAALALAGIGPSQVFQMGFSDQESITHLVEAIFKLIDFLIRIRPQLLLTHPYEGGHPDHDSACFVAHTACELLRARSMASPVLGEFTSYYGRAGRMVAADFLPGSNRETFEFDLPPRFRLIKQRMLKAYRTQQDFLKRFPVEIERFRLSPQYSFLQPPHSGPLFYESQNWGVGTQWRVAVFQALQTLYIQENEA